ncbi:MAG: hypothetical protein QCH96_04815 [Candidatus Thermoplasmatota archaeon]|nr:hypothetical protein [Candidatus Thermoplasmatota archaeon]
MSKKTSSKDNTVIMSDKYLTESGTQGGKILGDNLSLFSFVIGIPLLLVGIFGVFSILYNSNFESNMAIIILVVLFLIIGCLMTLGGYFLRKG